jgi:hypothetical protein
MNNKDLKYILLLFILILLIIFSYVYNLLYIDNFSDQYKKTIYLIWRNKKEHTNHGFGDKLRGAIHLYQYCSENKINFELDATDDVCSDILKNIVSKDYDKIKDKPLMFFTYENGTAYDIEEDIKKELSTKNMIYIYSHRYPVELTIDDKKFAKYICEPKDEIQSEINEKLKKLPPKFGIKHFRFDDKVFKNDVDSSDIIFNEFYELLKSEYKPTDILFTNSNNFKKYAKEKLGIKTIDCDNGLCKIEHIGESTDNDAVKNSFIEFLIISKAKYIKSYTVYDWPSNFVKWPSEIYDIPIENKYIDESTL